jgi:fluoride exporter
METGRGLALRGAKRLQLAIVPNPAKAIARQWSLPTQAGKAPRANDSYRKQAVWSFMLNYLSIMLGGALGTGARFWLSGWIAQRYGEFFPLDTLIVNITGCFLIGIFGGLSEPPSLFLVSPAARRFFMIGLCGGYTTFSSFGLQTLNLAQNGELWKATLNALLSLVCCVAAVWLGRVLALTLNAK